MWKAKTMKFDKELLQVLCPFGEWEHSKGMQIVDEESARRMKRSAGWSAMSSIPIYIGHPDDIPSKRKPKVVGKIKRICSTHDGIAVVAQYPKEIYKDVISGKFSAMSPRWQMEHIEGENYRPVKLISVGLTNNPNIADSGKILSMKTNSSVFKTTIFESRKIAQRISQLKNCISEIATKTESLKAQLNAERLSNRLKERQSSLPSKNMSERKMSVSKLVDAARTRSRMFGEPYTKSFSIVKKQNI